MKIRTAHQNLSILSCSEACCCEGRGRSRAPFPIIRLGYIGTAGIWNVFSSMTVVPASRNCIATRIQKTRMLALRALYSPGENWDGSMECSFLTLRLTCALLIK